MLIWHYYRIYPNYEPVGHTICLDNDSNLALKIAAAIIHINDQLNINFNLPTSHLCQDKNIIPSHNFTLYATEYQQCNYPLVFYTTDQNSKIYILLYSNSHKLLRDIKIYYKNFNSDSNNITEAKKWYIAPNDISNINLTNTSDKLLWNLYQIDIKRPTSPRIISLVDYK